MKYIVTPAASAAATTSGSRTEPPGCTIALTPAASSTSAPSAKGKNASEAATDPAARSPARVTARWHESTRFTWPIPMPTEAPPEASRIAFDFTERTARQANARSASVAASAAGPEARVQEAVSTTPYRSGSCTSTPPETCLNSRTGRSKPSGSSRIRRFFRCFSTVTASGSYPGATITSVKMPATASAIPG